MSNFISLGKAKEMTGRYQKVSKEMLKSEYQNQEILTISETIDGSMLEKLMNIEGCVNIRIYYGMDESLKMHAILVAVDKDDKDIIKQDENNYTSEEDILNNNRRCPPLCNDTPILE